MRRNERRFYIICLLLVGLCLGAIFLIAALAPDAHGAPGRGCVTKQETRATYVGEFRTDLRDRIGRDVPSERSDVHGQPGNRHWTEFYTTCQPSGAHVLKVRWERLTGPAWGWQTARWRWAPAYTCQCEGERP